MPYKDPERKTEWDLEHRPERRDRIVAATRWADAQIQSLETLYRKPITGEERRRLRSALRSQFLLDRYGLGKEPTISNPPTQ